MQTLEKQDIQGLLLKAYGRMHNTRYALLHVQNPVLARAWLSRITLEISDGNHPALETCLNIAFTFSGLKSLGLHDTNLRQFSREFREGMTTPHRQRLLGDQGESNPQFWRWGGPREDGLGMNDIHVLLLVFARSEAILHDYWAQLEPVIVNHGLAVVVCLDGIRTPENKEPFGFHDGIVTSAHGDITIDLDGATVDASLGLRLRSAIERALA